MTWAIFDTDRLGQFCNVPSAMLFWTIYGLVLFLYAVTFSMLFKPWASASKRFALGFLITFATVLVFVLGDLGYTLDKKGYLVLLWLPPHAAVILQYKNYVEEQKKNEKGHEG